MTRKWAQKQRLRVIGIKICYVRTYRYLFGRNHSAGDAISVVHRNEEGVSGIQILPKRTIYVKFGLDETSRPSGMCAQTTERESIAR